MTDFKEIKLGDLLATYMVAPEWEKGVFIQAIVNRVNALEAVALDFAHPNDPLPPLTSEWPVETPYANTRHLSPEKPDEDQG